MNIRIGCDLIHLDRFKTSFEQGGAAFLERLFTPHERAVTRTWQQCASMFAIKESVAKALGTVPPPWQQIEVSHHESGRPQVHLLALIDGAHTIDVSVAHDGDYLIAQALVVYFEK